jgi:hypothetical protein
MAWRSSSDKGNREIQMLTNRSRRRKPVPINLQLHMHEQVLHGDDVHQGRL